MNSSAIATLLICSGLMMTGLIVSLLLIRAIWNRNLETLSNLARRSEDERKDLMNQWAKERQNFLDRLMTKEWQSYAQLTNQSPSPSEWVNSPTEMDRGTGEVLIELD